MRCSARLVSVFVSILTAPQLLVAKSSSAQVYFYPSNPSARPENPPSLAGDEASVLIAQHLGFDMFEPINEKVLQSQLWNSVSASNIEIGQGRKDSVLVVIQSDSPSDFTPPNTKPLFTISDAPPASTFSDVLHAYIEKAYRIFSSVASSPSLSLDALDVAASEGAALFKEELGSLLSAVEERFSGNGRSSKGGDMTFSAFEMKGLVEIEKAHGKDSEVYQMAAKSLQGFMSLPELETKNVVIIVTSPDQDGESTTSEHHKRFVTHDDEFSYPLRSDASSHVRDNKQRPIISNLNKAVWSTSTCYKDNSTCAEATNGCSGHGSCAQITHAGKSCFSCQCEVTHSEKNGRKIYWAGASCEKVDISTSFVLLAGSTIFLILLIGGSIGLLYSIGYEKLPNTLTAAAAPASKRE